MGKLFLTITIDTENPQSGNLFNTIEDTMLSSPERKYGVEFITKIFNCFDIKASWYLNIYEKYHLGEKVLSKICDNLLKHNQDIQLHTHPVCLMDADKMERVYMNQYNLEEQIEIIETGINDIKKITGIKPIAHRGGAYGVNSDTLIALEKCGIKVDSSLFYGNNNCKIYCKVNNTISRINNVLEFPVSYYTLNEKRINSSGATHSIKKVDINYSSFYEIKNVIEQAKKNNDIYLHLFMHSFSFYKLFWITKYSEKNWFDPEIKSIAKLYAVMQLIRNDTDIQIVTVAELYKRIENKNIARFKNPKYRVNKMF